jgi:hypothetical protein
VTSSLEYLMAEAGKPLHFSEAYKIYKEINPETHMTKRLMHSTLTRTPNVVLWDRGTFVHTKVLPFPYELIRKIEDSVFKDP